MNDQEKRLLFYFVCDDVANISSLSTQEINHDLLSKCGQVTFGNNNGNLTSSRQLETPGGTVEALITQMMDSSFKEKLKHPFRQFPLHTMLIGLSLTQFRVFLTIMTHYSRKIKSIMTDYHSKFLLLIGQLTFCMSNVN